MKYNSLNHFLRTEAAKRDIKLSHLAKQINVPMVAMYDDSVSLKNIKRIADFFGIDKYKLAADYNLIDEDLFDDTLYGCLNQAAFDEGLSLSQLAKKIGINPGTLYKIRYEEPSYSTIYKLSMYFDIDEESLMEYKEYIDINDNVLNKLHTLIKNEAEKQNLSESETTNLLYKLGIILREYSSNQLPVQYINELAEFLQMDVSNLLCILENTNTVTLYIHVKSKAIENNMSIAKLAKALDLRPITIYKWAKKQPDVKSYMALSQYLNESLDFLINLPITTEV